MQHTLFATQIYQNKLCKKPAWNKLSSALQDEALKIQAMDLRGQKWSKKHYPKGYTSYASMGELHLMSPYFKELKNFIDEHVKTFVKQLEYDILPKQLYMNSCWINIMAQGASHSWHIHPLSMISGTVYLSIPKNASAIKFEDPRLDKYMALPTKKTNSAKPNQTYFSISPAAGEIILFESWLRHEVPYNNSSQDRLSISFNYSWR